MQAIGFYEFMCENRDQALADDPPQWIRTDYQEWKRHQQPRSDIAYAASISGITTGTTAGIIGTATNQVASATKTADDTLQTWRRGKRDVTQYEVLEADEYYTKWIIKVTRQFKLDECDRMSDQSFKSTQVIAF